MPGTAIIGTQWGDEGKGKITDLFAKEYDVIVRSAGGANAGHTIYDEKGTKFIFHIMPSGVLYPNKQVMVGNGVVLDPDVLCETLDKLDEKGYKPDLTIDECTHVILPYHKLLDGVREGRRKKKIGTTKRGIGPAYGAKVERTTAVRFMDFVDKERLGKKLDEILPIMFERLFKISALEEITQEWKEDILKHYAPLIEKLTPFIGNVPLELEDIFLNPDEKKVLFEGAQGTLLDVDHGTYPFVTSSNSTIGGLITGTGVPPNKIQTKIGVLKAYTTRVGEGPFPTEIRDELGEKIREKGGEYGATTGRPRRCGWLDLNILRHALMVNGLDALAVTKLDVLDGIDPLMICTHYELDGKEIKYFPRDIRVLERVKPVFTKVKGWPEQDWSRVEEKDEMPENALEYLGLIENICPIDLVSVGPKREETIWF